MGRMARKKSKSGEKEAVQDAPPKPRSGTPIHAWIDEELGEAFKRYLTSMEVKITATSAIEVALKEFLRNRGFWPPK